MRADHNSDAVMRHHEFVVETGDRQTVDITAQVAAILDEGDGDGLLNVFIPHATAGVAIFETGAGSEEDLSEALARLFPRDDRYHHRHGSPGHGADHVIPAFIAPAITIPVVSGRMALGTWQRIVLVDPNVDNPARRVLVSFL
jgi:secondary thiamine-phosphate synthase enzyme